MTAQLRLDRQAFNTSRLLKFCSPKELVLQTRILSSKTPHRAYVPDNQDRQRSRPVREFMAEFRGMSGTAKQKQVLGATGTARSVLIGAKGKHDE